MKFDVIVGNPPYNDEREKHNGNSIWDKFVKKSLECLNDNGYMSLVHPSKWRKINSKLWSILTKNQIYYLEIHNLEDGLKTFNCYVRYDWYILQKKETFTYTTILDENGIINKINLNEKSWLPNFDFNLIDKLIAKNEKDSLKILYTNDYRTDKKYISMKKSNIYKYPIVKGVENGKYTFYYSSKKLSMFGIPKVICSTAGLFNPLNDFEGKYGLKKDAFAITISSKKEGDEIVLSLKTKKALNFSKAIVSTGYVIDRLIFNNFKNYFWKEFVD
jgi:hypothetical protein